MKKVPNTRNTYVDTEGNFFKNDRKLKIQTDTHGYSIVSLVYEDGVWKNCLAHRQVALTFLPNPENKPCVNHINGIKHDNRLSNLEWCTYSENTIHAYETGLQIPPKGEEVWNSKLRHNEVHLICKMLQEGYRNIEIAEKLNIPKYHLKNIRCGKTWTYISEKYNIPKRSRTISDKTAHWICRKLQEGMRISEVCSLSNNPSVSKSQVSKIKRRQIYKDISVNYKF